MPLPEVGIKNINIDNLRGVVRNYIERHHYEAAVFWGDKVVSLSDGAPTDVYWLMQAYILTRQYHRAALLVNTHNLSGNGSFRYLSALCHSKVNEYQEALSLLEGPSWPCDDGGGGLPCGGTSASSRDKVCPPTPLPELDDVVSLECSRQLLRARIYEETDNRVLATECYQAALMADPLCYEALQALTHHHMLTTQEERDLVASLPLMNRCSTEEEAEFVRVCYETKLNKCTFNQSSKTFINLDELPVAAIKLTNNLDIVTARAERLYYKCNFVSCFQLTRAVLEQDPYHTECLPVHIACLIELQQANVLFLLAHKLVDLYPETALAWFAVGAYYYLIGKNENARRYLSKASTIDKVFGPAWIAFAHSFAAENEHDQASAAYFKAAQLMKGSHLPLLYIGMEYSLTNNPKFAEKFFQKAVEMAPEDPFVLHELGVVHFNNQQFEVAESHFRRALVVVSGLYGEAHGYYNLPTKWTGLLNNLGHTLRKLGRYQEALQFHYEAVRVLPSEASTFTAIGLCLGIAGDYEEAIAALHTSLSLQRDQTVATTLLNTLMEQMATTEQPFPDEDDIIVPEYSDIMQRIAKQDASSALVGLGGGGMETGGESTGEGTQLGELTGTAPNAEAAEAAAAAAAAAVVAAAAAAQDNAVTDINFLLGTSIGNPELHSTNVVEDTSIDECGLNTTNLSTADQSDQPDKMTRDNSTDNNTDNNSMDNITNADITDDAYLSSINDGNTAGDVTGNATNRSVLTIEDMVMDDDSD